MQANFTEIILQELEFFFEPLPQEADKLYDFFASIGYDFDKIFKDPAKIKQNWVEFRQAVEVLIQLYKTHYKPLVAAVKDVELPGLNKTEIKEFINGYPENLADLIGMVTELSGEFDKFDGVIKILEGHGTHVQDLAGVDKQAVVDAVGNLPRRLLNLLAFWYLARRHEVIIPTLELLDFIDQNDKQAEIKVGTEVFMEEQTFPAIRFKALGELIKEGGGYFQERYWAENFRPDGTDALKRFAYTNASGQNFFGKIKDILAVFGAQSTVGLASEEGLENLTLEEKERLKGMISFRRPIYNPSTEKEDELGASLGFLVADDLDKGPGIFVIPFGSFSFQVNFGRWQLDSDAKFDAQGFKINKDGLSLFDGSTPSFTTSVKLSPQEGKEKIYMLGAMQGPRIEIGQPQLRAGLSAQNKKAEYFIAFDLINSALAVAPKGTDGFWSKMIGKEIRMPFNFAIAWSNTKGIHIEGSIGLEIALASSLNLFNVLKIQRLRLKLGVNQDEFNAGLYFDATLNIGPVEATVGGLGMIAGVSFPKQGQSSSTKLSFAKPTMLKLKIDTSTVVLGGFIERSENRYTGIVQINIKQSINIVAIGILDTKMPDGSEGYSLLFVIFADGFTPIQLGMGFTLNGVGGLLALHRTMDTEVLRNGVRDGSLTHLLFPKDPLKDDNANKIIRSLDTAFPIFPGKFVFGPMAKIAWGSGKALIELDLGLLIEVPKPVRVAIPGILRSSLPDDKNPKVLIQALFIGIIEFEKKYISFDCSIYNSRIATMALYGDIIVRLRWGNDPLFLFASGGFHPRFTPPPGTPSGLKRITLALLDEEKAKVRMEFYMAITSNTVQTGARIDAEFRQAGFSAVGFLSFDALFQFKPFRVYIDINATVCIKQGSTELMAAMLSFSLEGPNPWIIQGKAYFKFLKQECSVQFYKEIRSGEAAPESFPDAKLLSLLEEEFKKPDAIQAILPSEKPNLVRLSHAETNVIHPAGELHIRQKTVPFKVKIDHFGQGKVIDGSQFEIKEVRIPGLLLDIASPLTESFPPAQFFNLSDDKKLSSPSFSKYACGVVAKAPAPAGSKTGTACVIDQGELDVIIVGSGDEGSKAGTTGKGRGLQTMDAIRLPQKSKFRWAPSDFYRLARTSAPGQSPLSARNRFPAPVSKQGEFPGDFVEKTPQCRIVHVDTLEPFNSEAYHETDGHSVLNQILKQNPSLEGRLRVVPELELI